MSQIINLNGNGGGGGGTVSALTGNAGGAVGPTAGNINILGSGPITVTGNAGTSTLTIAMTVPLPIADGGTNATSFTTTDGTIYFDGSSLVTTSTGTAGYVLTSAGPGVAPSYQAVTASGAVTSVAGGNNITISGTATAPIVNVSGTTQHAVQIGNATGSLTSLAVGATNTVLLGNTGADPSYGTVPNAALTNSSVTLSNGNNITVTGSPLSLGGTASFNLTGTTNHTVQVGNASGSLTSITAGTTGQVLTGVTGADPSFQSPAASSISITGNTGGALVGAAFTFTGGTTGLSFGGAGSTETLSGTLAVANGGTGATGLTGVLIGNGGLSAVTASTLTQHDVLVGGASNTITSVSPSTSGFVLTSGGVGADPSFLAPAASSITITGNTGGALAGAAFTFTGGTTGLSFGGSGSTETLSGTLAIGNGGTNASSMTNTFGVNYFDGTRLVTTTVGTAAQVLTSNGAGVAPTFQASAAAGVSSITGTANQITASASTGAVTLSTPSTFIAPGSIAATTTVTATLGNITATSGNIVATSGNITLAATTSSSIGSILIDGNSWLHAFGATADANSFVGSLAGNYTLTSGTSTGNSGFGNNALAALTTAIANTCIGSASGASITTSSKNTAVGRSSLTSLTTATAGGGYNCCLGWQAGENLSTGQANILIGVQAGLHYTGAESSNILIGHIVQGTLGESNVLRIGVNNGTSLGDLAKAFIQGISGVTVTGTAVLCATNGQLGTIASSRRFKDDIVDMTQSEVIHKFRPVTFTMKNDNTKHKQWGLIAEEVQEIYPELVNSDEDGNPYSVRYLDLIPMLLKEVQILRKEVDALKGAK